MPQHAPTVEDAILLAVAAHRGQRYPSAEAEPYVFHPLRLMVGFASASDQMAAVLHDVVEDTNVSLAELVERDYPAEVVAAVDSLTHRRDETYEDYVDRLAANDIARRVKLADLHENLRTNLLSPAGPGNADRIARYEAALTRLASPG